MSDRHDAPEGFAPFPFTTGFVGVNGPLYARRADGGRIHLGFRVEERHCNPMRIAHGGMLGLAQDVAAAPDGLDVVLALARRWRASCAACR
jgi:acyl-coenzyme A thioesterase PaaI-like protein